MKLADLSSIDLDKVKANKWCDIVEEDEDYEIWNSSRDITIWNLLRYKDVQFSHLAAWSYQLNVTTVFSIWRESGNSITLFLKDINYDDNLFLSGFLPSVIGQKRDFFLGNNLSGMVYHQTILGILES